MNLVKKGNAILNKFKNCGIKNFPEVARKNNRPKTITNNIIFLYISELAPLFFLAFLIISNIIMIKMIIIKKRNINFIYINLMIVQPIFI